MKKWVETKFGLVPYEKVIKVTFSFEGITKEAVAFTQYQFLLNDAIIQAHLESTTMKGIAIMVPSVNPEQVLKEAGLKYKIIDKEIIPYEKVLESNYMFIE